MTNGFTKPRIFIVDEVFAEFNGEVKLLAPPEDIKDQLGDCYVFQYREYIVKVGKNTHELGVRKGYYAMPPKGKNPPFIKFAQQARLQLIDTIVADYINGVIK